MATSVPVLELPSPSVELLLSPAGFVEAGAAVVGTTVEEVGTTGLVLLVVVDVKVVVVADGVVVVVVDLTVVAGSGGRGLDRRRRRRQHIGGRGVDGRRRRRLTDLADPAVSQPRLPPDTAHSSSVVVALCPQE